MESQFLNVLTKKFTWKIHGFSKLVESKHYSQSFTIDGLNWRILMHPKGNQTDHLSLYLDVPEAENMPTGWKQTACFSFILVNQFDEENCKILRKGVPVEFTGRKTERGYRDFLPLVSLHELSNGYLVGDTVIVEVKLEAEPATASFYAHFSNLAKFLNQIEDLPRNETVPYVTPRSPVECPSDLFNLKMKISLDESLLNLSKDGFGLTADQQRSVRTFQEGFNDFTSDSLPSELSHSRFKLLNVQKSRVLSDLRFTLETHRSFAATTDELSEREERILRRIQGIASEKEGLVSEWDVLLVESKEAQRKYEIQEKKVEELVEQMMSYKERLRRSISAWADMKAQFS